MTMLVSACNGVQLLLLLFVLCQDLVGVPITPRHAIVTRTSKIVDRPFFPKSMDSDVASKVDWCIRVTLFLQGVPTSMDVGFIRDCRRL